MLALRLSIVTILISLSGNAQGYYHSPNDTLWASTVLDQQVTMNITQVHTSNDTLQFVWQKVNVDIPFGWDATICDNSNCNLALIDGDTTLPVLPGDDGLLLIHCTPHITAGVGIIQYSMFEINQPAQIDTLTWIIVANSLSLYENQNDFGELLLKNDCLKWVGKELSNPTIKALSMNGSESALIYDEALKEISLTNLKTAVYWIVLEDQGKNYYKKINYFKHD
ncbi:MAG: hypothetical protein RI922_1114 [Bacteroidota bacterium]|jgi:hypothetical protein